MKTLATALIALLSLSACKDLDPRQPREVGPAQIVALVVKTEPPGATVRVNKLSKTWTSPCDIADYSLGKGVLDVEVSLAGYQTVTTKAKYDGFDPVTMDIRMIRTGAAPEPVAAPVPAPAPPPAKAPAPVPVPVAPAPAPAPAPAAKIEPAAGGTRLKINSPNAKVRIQAKSVVTDSEKPGEYFLPNVPPDKVTVEFLDPKTGAVLQSLEITPPSAPAGGGARAPEPLKEMPVVDADRVGEIKMVSKTYGVYMKLDPGLMLQPGEEILIYRDGREVARTKILKITKADANYPDGAALLQKGASIQKGDEVRREKP